MSTYRSEHRSSGSSVSSNGSAYQLILDHILTYPGSYEIPLRTMYTLNCQPRGQPRSATPTSNASSPIAPQGTFPDNSTTETFTQNLMTQLSNLPSNASTLPPSFITSFVQRCFPSELTHVDFPQALTGLDYLKDLELRRRREVAAAMVRLNIDRETLADDTELSDEYPGVLQWVRSIEEKERKVDALYTQVYVGLRRWILINELSLRPFNKHNCIAMLNTLYPPMGMANQPTSKLTPAVLKSQREGFFKYIQTVERSGSSVLANLMSQGKGASDANGWAAVTRTLSMFLQLANSIISECIAIAHIDDVSPARKRDSNQSRHNRKADSGISFSGSDHRPSTRGSTGDAPSSPTTQPMRPKTPSGPRPGTALEKLARGLKGIGRSRTDVSEIISDHRIPAFPAPAPEKPTMLRKMRSMGALTDRKGSFSNLRGNDAPAFDIEEMRRHRMKFEANQTPLSR